MDVYKFGTCAKCKALAALKNNHCKDCCIEYPDILNNLFNKFNNGNSNKGETTNETMP